ncbi:hypothetical protein PspLS_06075 [Pyricularia sp. CBS 133598]|nr:hypothetical protein PspLS_06075 [Pyricularia sp. CBS 133598]
MLEFKVDKRPLFSDRILSWPVLPGACFKCDQRLKGIKLFSVIVVYHYTGSLGRAWGAVPIAGLGSSRLCGRCHNGTDMLQARIGAILFAVAITLLVHDPEALILAPPAGLVDVELSGAGTGAGALDVGDDLGRRGEPGLLVAAGRETYLLVGLGEEGVEVRGLLRDRGQRALLGRALGTRVGRRRDAFRTLARHCGLNVPREF